MDLADLLAQLWRLLTTAAVIPPGSTFVLVAGGASATKSPELAAYAATASAVFAAVTATVALLTVRASAKDRRLARLPRMELEVAISQGVGGDPGTVILNIRNDGGGSAYGVQLMGSIGSVGWFGRPGMITNWGPGQFHRFALVVPPDLEIPDQSQAAVMYSDASRRLVVARTAWGGQKDWKVGRFRKSVSPENAWTVLYPDVPFPTELELLPIGSPVEQVL